MSLTMLGHFGGCSRYGGSGGWLSGPLFFFPGEGLFCYADRGKVLFQLFRRFQSFVGFIEEIHDSEACTGFEIGDFVEEKMLVVCTSRVVPISDYIPYAVGF